MLVRTSFTGQDQSSVWQVSKTSTSKIVIFKADENEIYVEKKYK